MISVPAPRLLLAVALVIGSCLVAATAARGVDPPASLLRSHLLVTYYGNPHSAGMGVLGRLTGDSRADALRRQAEAYAHLTQKRVLAAYHLVAVVAQPHAGRDGMWRRRESREIIREVLTEARRHGFHLVLDVQPGRADLDNELTYLRQFLIEPDVHLALDPEFDMDEGKIPGRTIGHMPADDVNAAVRCLSSLIATFDLPSKVLIVHQFTVNMLPDVQRIENAPGVDLVLDMDGFGSQELKLATYRTIMRRWSSGFAGFKLFYTIDTNLFRPEDVMRLKPSPSVVIYQ